ncbi:MAG: acetate--CoA ligase family protein [Desulfamplus sp.]|nr:acetate--CoA ligase family protein [Desulfamplus sp.]
MNHTITQTTAVSNQTFCEANAIKQEAVCENRAKSIQTLCEDEAKAILQQYGIPVVNEIRVKNQEEAVNAASILGFPSDSVEKLVVKGVGSKFAHKSEMGLVYVGISDHDELKKAVSSIVEIGGEELEGILIQPMVKGKRELVAGMFRDPQYGPVIMFGLGGIFTEALKDVSFRLAPLTDWDIEEMINEISSKTMFGNFRGEKAIDKEQIKSVLSGLSKIALSLPEIKEVDINPLIATSDGQLVAVDALIIKDVVAAGQITGKPLETGVDKELSSISAITTPLTPSINGNTRPPVDKVQLASLFYPKSVAFVGASGTLGKWGHMLLTNALSGKFKGKIYLVNPKGGTIVGQHVYPSISDIESDIDLAVVTLPANKVLETIPQLKAKNAKGILLITSGFSETGENGLKLEREVVEKAAQSGMIVLGPNTMGICNPHIDFACSGAHVHPLPGSTALICQSGNMGTQLLAFAEQQGIGIRAFSGSGNEAMVTIEDYMELFEIDEKTKSVVLYIESVKDGRRFFESAKRVSEKKPVIVLTGGRTDIGRKAAASHTGALASNAKVTASAFKQAGIIEVGQPMDLLDMSALFSSMPLPKGNRVAIMTLGGGWGVVTSDLCAEHNLEVPTLSPDIIKTLNPLLPDYWSHANPVDIVGENDPNIPKVALEELLKWDGCDAVIHLGIHGKRIFIEKMVDSIAKVDPAHSRESLTPLRDMLIDFESEYVSHVIKLTEKYEKPVLGVSLLTDSTTKTLYRVDGCKYSGLFFPSPERAVKALSGMCKYSRWLRKF